MGTIETDVLIVGSGFGAAAPALRLSKAGFKVTLVEKGPNVDAPGDFRQTQDPKYILRYLKGVSGENINFTFAEALGGGSGFYEMVCLRAPSLAFEQRDRAGRRLWPAGLERRSLDPYYDLAERMLGVEQIRPGEIPKSGLVFSLLMRNLGYSCDRARYAVKGCVGSGFCVTGCVYGAKRSLHFNYLPQAMAAGARIRTGVEAVSVRTLCEVRRTPIDGSLGEVPHRYEVLCREGNDWRRFRTRLLVLAGGTVGTAALLLRSRDQLRFLSDHLGRNIAFNGSVKAVGILPEDMPDGDMFSGRSHPGMISYHFLKSHGITIAAAKPLPLQALAAARLKLDGDTRDPAYWGAPHTEIMKVYRRRVMVLVAFGLTLPTAELRLSGHDLDARLELTGDLRAYYRRTKKLLQSILLRNGCRLLDPEFISRDGSAIDDLYFSTAHQVGSCRMGQSAETGVVDSWGQVFGYPGMYVSDGAVVPSSLAVNSALTILANAERIAAGIRDRYRVDTPIKAETPVTAAST